MKYVTVVNDETATIMDVESASYAIYKSATQLKKRADHTLKGGNYKLEVYKGGKESLAGKPIEERTVKCHPKVPMCTSRRGHKWEDKRCLKCGLLRNITENTVSYKKYKTGDSITIRRARVSDAFDCIEFLDDDSIDYEASLTNTISLIREARVVITIDDYNDTVLGICALVKNWGKSARIKHFIIDPRFDHLTDGLLLATIENVDVPIYMHTIFIESKPLEKFGFKQTRIMYNYYRTGEDIYEYRLDNSNKKK